MKLVVAGDVILDRWTEIQQRGSIVEDAATGSQPRFGAEATHEGPGGAAAVAYLAAALRAEVSFTSAVGDDDAGRRLRQLLESAGIGCNLAIAHDRPTTVKTRYNGAAAFRIDHECTQPIARETILRAFEPSFPKMREAQVVVLANYNKGLFGKGDCWNLALPDEVVGEVAARPLVVVDPGRNGLQHAFECSPKTVYKLSRRDADCASRGQAIHFVCRQQAVRRSRLVAVTLDSDGAVAADQELLHDLPAVPIAPVDTCGCGDTFLAALAVRLAAGAGALQALWFANSAAAVQATLPRIQQVTHEMVQRELSRQSAATVDE